MNTTRKLLKPGNAKLDKSILIFSLPPVITCPNCKDCAKGCYALKDYNGMHRHVVKPAWDYNFEIAKQTDLFIATMCEELQHTTKKAVRLHGAGDFFSIEYINAWHEIATKNPEIKFFTYTKTYKHISPAWDAALERLMSLKNFNIVESMPLNQINFGDDNYIVGLKKAIREELHANAVICPCGYDNTIKCGVDCVACINRKYVLFKKH